MKLKLRGKFLLPTIALVIVCLAVLGYLSYHFAGDALKDSVEEQIEERTKALETQVSAWLSERRREVRNWSSTKLYSDALQDGFVAKAARKTASLTMTDLLKEYNSLESLNLANTTGEVVASSDENNIGSSINDRDYFKEAMKGALAISPVLISWTTGAPIFIIAAPVEKSGNVTGVLYATVDLGSFNSKFIDSVKIGNSGYAFMFDKHGLIIAYPPDPEKILDMDMSMLPFGKKMIAQGNGIINYSLNDISKITAFRRNDETGWTVCMAALNDEIFAPATRIRNINLVLTIVMTVIIGLAMTFLVSQVVSKPLRKVVKVIEKLSKGNLRDRANIVSSDELGQLSSAVDEFTDNLSGFTRVLGEIGQGDLSKDVPPFSDEDEIGPAAQAMLDNLRDIVSRVDQTSANIANGSAQVSDSSQALSQGATQQAASIEEITSSMTELGGQTNTNAENAAQANSLATSARNSAQKGNEQMEEMIGAMKDISDSSKEIAKIIKAIDDIAFQTNLLALNAAVEAARAGKHGKGFAVVAQEVRNLAGRSAKAAQETAELIEGAVNNVDTGTSILSRTAEALSEIMESSTKVTDLVAEIAAASNEQAQGITQINQGLSQVEQVTQQNTASAEETASASVELSTQAADMRKLLQRFTLKTHEKATGQKQAWEGDEPESGEAAMPVSPGLSWDDPDSGKDSQIMSPEDVISLDDDDFSKF